MLQTLALAACLFLPGQVEDIEADIVLANATLIDGTGEKPIRGDLAIKNDRIVAIGVFKHRGAKVLDCTGLVIAPGFIDLHTHSDTPLTLPGTAPNLNYLTQGVTTAVTGNCGAGPVDVADYYARMEKLGIGSNVAHQVPHNAVRQQVMGNADRDPTPAELKLMEELVEKGMKEGAWGLSTGLIYNPGTYAKTEELIALAMIAHKFGGFYASHIRDEGAAIFKALEEILAICRRVGIRVHISHIKVTGRANWGKAGDVIALVRRARKEGLDVTADQYPYAASSTSLAAMVIPAKYREGTSEDFLKRLDDPMLGLKLRDAIRDNVEKRLGGKSLRIASFPPRTDWHGKDLETLSKSLKLDVVDLVLDIQKKGGAGVVSFGMHEDDVRLFMKEPYVATASDGSSQVPSDTIPHPRSYGTFPRKIGKYAIEDGNISLEQAIRGASGLPADILRLPERGYLKKGYFADVVVFDPKTFRDRATYDEPHVYSTGVAYLFVNGRLAIDQGRYTGARAGRVLRHK